MVSMRKEINIKKINPFLSGIVVFISVFIFFVIFRAITGNIIIDDSFYHIKHAYLLRTQGLEQLESFPWMNFSIMNTGFSDYSFLYHVFLIPFTLGNLLLGIKISGAVMSALLFCVLYLILKKLNVKYPFIWSILALSSNAFLYRLLLARPFTLAIILSLLVFSFSFKKRYLSLLVTGLVNALSYGVFIVALVINGALFLMKFIKEKTLDFKLPLFLVFGLLLGYLIHPNFPNNFIINSLINFYPFYSDHSPISELMPSDFKSLITQNILIWIIFCGLLSILIYYRQELKKLKEKISVEGLTAFLLSIFFFILTIRSQRFIEYWVPFTVLAGAIVARDFKVDVKLIEGFKKIWNTEHQPSNITSSTFQSVKSVKGDTLDRRTNNMDHDQYITRSRIFLAMLAVLLSIIISLSFFKSFYNNYTSLKNADPYDRLKPASEWLIKNTPDKSIVYNVAWDEFPELFFWNTHNYYIVGMDPTFLYEYDKSLYKKYQDIYEGKDKNPSQTIKKYFNSKYIFSGKTNKDFIIVAEKDKNLEKAYEDQWSLIYKVAN